jgi:hypothetical protein
VEGIKLFCKKRNILFRTVACRFQKKFVSVLDFYNADGYEIFPKFSVGGGNVKIVIHKKTKFHCLDRLVHGL